MISISIPKGQNLGVEVGQYISWREDIDMERKETKIALHDNVNYRISFKEK